MTVSRMEESSSLSLRSERLRSDTFGLPEATCFRGISFGRWLTSVAAARKECVYFYHSGNLLGLQAVNDLKPIDLACLFPLSLIR